MSRKGVPVKTNKGTLEIKERMLGLAPRVRTALLLVDGVKSAAELENLMSAAGVTPGALQLLLAKGLIRFPDEGQMDVASREGVAVQQHKPVAALEVSESQSVAPPKIHHAASAPSAISPFVARPSSKPVPAAPKTSHASAVTPKTANGAALPALEVVPLVELESILGEVTKMEMETILGVASLLELSPTQMGAPTISGKASRTKSARAQPTARADERNAPPSAAESKRIVAPAYVSRMNLMVARAHLANALDQFLEIDGYLLKQKVIACESREDIEKLFRLVEGALLQKLEKSATLRIMGIARAVLER